MSLEKEIREKLIAEDADYKKLDQLARQGMLPAAQLPMLHRGLDKMKSGKVLNPQEREAVNKVLQSMLYIVTGDSTVFQKAKQHTQKTRYQTEEVQQEEDTIFQEGQFWGQDKMAAKSREMMSPKTHVKLTRNSKGGLQRATVSKKNKMKIAQMKKDGYQTEEGQQEEDTIFQEGYKEKFDAMLKKAGKSLKDMSDEEKKTFFNKVDAAHKAKDESTEEDTLDEIMVQRNPRSQRSKVKRMSSKDTDSMFDQIDSINKELGKKPPKKPFKKTYGREETEAEVDETLDEVVVKGNKVPWDRHWKQTSMSYDKAIQKYGRTNVKREKNRYGREVIQVVTEGSASDSEEMRAKTQRKLKRLSDMKARQEKQTDQGYKSAIKETAASDARRDANTDSSGLAKTKSATKDDGNYKGKGAGKERDGGHIVMQLHKAITINKPVKFKDGSSHNISKGDAHKYLSKYMKSKPADKEKMHAAHDSHDSFQTHINS